MRLEKRWVLGGLLAAAGVGVIAAVTARPKIREASRVLLIGDSLAKGLDVHMRSLAKEEGVAYLGQGVSGSRLDQWAKNKWLDEALASFQPTLVLVSLGTNDEYLGPNAAATQAPYLRALLQKLEATGADVVWIGVPTLPVRGGGVADLVEHEAPHHFPSRDYRIPRGPDQLHPTAAGYAGWAGAIWRWLT